MILQTGEQLIQVPQIECSRLLLRSFEAADFETAYRLFSDADVQKYLSLENKRTPERLRKTLECLRLRWAERNFGIWCVGEKTSGEMIGYCGFQLLDETTDIEIVFAFLKEQWNKGFATEAANACFRFGFEHLERGKIYAVIHPENAASQRVLKKIGMSFERASEQYQMNLKIYSIARAEYVAPDDFYRLTKGKLSAPKSNPSASATGAELYFTADCK